MNPLRVLVVDDMPAFREAARDWLREDGCAVMMAENGKQAANLLKAETFDLVITDIIMPDGDGIELIRVLRTRYSQTKIVAISAGSAHLGPDIYVTMARRFGVEAVLLKPFDQQQLREIISALFPAAAKELAT